MELATNLFSKGLLMDTNPMVQGNETLTDCLNGTLITMNGNEVILLNDMGNRRVNDAFLPSGYEPVGMKEYGGVIYVAAYNPITNKSQIGSFPSPLRKIDTETTNEEISFDFSSFFPIPDNLSKGKFLLLDSFLIPLVKENLHAGDKFSIWSSGLSTMKSDLTNYDNIKGNKASSPKNKEYTIRVGILNSLNLFVDITKTLGRWQQNYLNEWELKKYGLEVSDIFKFNDGYFIPDEFDNENLFEGIEDAKLIKHRQKLAINTYAYKLIGPLYLNIKLNHIENFNYDILGTYDEKNKKAKLKITSYITYNCPDSVVGNTPGNENYYTFEEGTPTDFKVFDLRRSNEEGYLEPPNKVQYCPTTYNINSNTYTTKVEKYYEDIVPTSGNIFEYFLGVLASNLVENVYLKGISEYGSIDLSLLGSGLVKLTGWKFYNNIYEEDNEDNLDSNTILNIYLNAYPEPGTLFKNLRFKFKEIEQSDNTTILYADKSPIYYPQCNLTGDYDIPIFEGVNLNNGRTTLNIDWNSIGLEKNKLYEVKIYYDIIDEFSGEIKDSKELEENNIKRWFLTTTLFNIFFNDVTIKDFSTETSEKFREKMNFNLYIDDTLDYSSTDWGLEIKGSLISKTLNIKYISKHKNELIIKTDPKMKIKDSYLYPDILLINSSVATGVDLGFPRLSHSSAPVFDSSRVKVSINNKETLSANTTFIDELTKHNGNLENRVNLYEMGTTDNREDMFSYSCHIISNKQLNINCVNCDAFIGYSSTPTSNINLFSNISNMALDIPVPNESYNLIRYTTPNIDLPANEGLIGYYGGIVFNSLELEGPKDKHKLYAYKNLISPIFNTYPIGVVESGIIYEEVNFTRGIEGTDYELLEDISKDKEITFKFSDIESKIFNFFGVSTKQIFKFCTLPNYSAGKKGNSGSMGTPYYHDREYYGFTKHNKDTYDINDSTLCYKANHLARVWWKAADGWVMFDDLFDIDTGLSLYFGDSHDTSLSNENIQVKFKNFLSQNFNKDYIYCRYKNITGDLFNYYITKDNFVYNDNYTISVKFTPIYKKLTSLEQVPLCTTVKYGNLQFSSLLENYTEFESNKYAEIILKSNLDFINNITDFIENLIKGNSINIYDKTGLVTDSEGQLLQEDQLYYLENEKIYPVKHGENEYFKVVDITENGEDTTNKKYALTFAELSKVEETNYPTSRYDFLRALSNNDGNIKLDYKGAHTPSHIIVNTPTFTNGNFGGNRLNSTGSVSVQGSQGTFGH